jgi:hypothetical protein
VVMRIELLKGIEKVNRTAEHAEVASAASF